MREALLGQNLVLPRTLPPPACALRGSECLSGTVLRLGFPSQ